jgi:hypothetical protein
MTYTVSADNIVNIVNILNAGWTAANTDNTTPYVKDIADSRPIEDLSWGDAIYVSRVDEVQRIGDIGINFYTSEMRMSVDIRTKAGRPRLDKLQKEFERVMQANRQNPTDSSGAFMPFRMIVLDSNTDLSNKTIKVWRMVYDIKLYQPVKIPGV